MKILLLIILSFFSLEAVAAARVPETLKVRLGQSKTADRGRVAIKFVSVVEDSRCPIDARCVWAGNARIKIAVSKGKSPERTVEINSGVAPQSATLYGYEMTFVDLMPQKGAKGTSPTIATISLKKVN